MKTSELKQHIKAIEDVSGRLTAKDVVNHARDPNHPLHSQFEWDDSVAGEKYREQQARVMLHRVQLYQPDQEEVDNTPDVVVDRTPQYIPDPSVNRGEQGMRNIERITVEEDRRIAMRRELVLAQSYMRRAQKIAIALDFNFNDEIATILETVDDLLVRLEDHRESRTTSATEEAVL